jgi:hypothetical protein
LVWSYEWTTTIENTHTFWYFMQLQGEYGSASAWAEILVVKYKILPTIIIFPTVCPICEWFLGSDCIEYSWPASGGTNQIYLVKTKTYFFPIWQKDNNCWMRILLIYNLNYTLLQKLLIVFWKFWMLDDNWDNACIWYIYISFYHLSFAWLSIAKIWTLEINGVLKNNHSLWLKITLKYLYDKIGYSGF